jgi:mannose-1-phosphate guanylyltransferase
MQNTKVLILAGGVGTRFWPISKQEKPKQFLDILGTGKSLLQECFDRYSEIVPANNIYVITNKNYKDLVLAQLPSLTESQVMSEPFGKNTAACIAYAAYKFTDENPNSTMIVAPSDHLIMDRAAFFASMKKAVNYAQNNDVLVTLGLKPHRPDTGYGYIQYSNQAVEEDIHEVVTFTEKPPLELAEKFIKSGDFLWNSGMFVWSCSSIIKSFNSFLPEMSLAFEGGNGAYNTAIEFEHISKVYSQISAISIDNGILEKAENTFVIPSSFGWSDLGTWKSVQENIDSVEGNHKINVDLHAIESENNLVVSSNHKLVVIQGVNDLFIIDSGDALLICKNTFDQGVKSITLDIKKKFNDKYN